MKSKQQEYPMVEELTKRERAILRKAVNGEIQVQFRNFWFDDHLACCDAVVNGVKVSFWWVGMEVVGAFMYSDSAKAVDVISDTIKNALDG